MSMRDEEIKRLKEELAEQEKEIQIKQLQEKIREKKKAVRSYTSKTDKVMRLFGKGLKGTGKVLDEFTKPKRKKNAKRKT